MSLSLQRANLRDAGFIFSLAQNGARHGHFNQKVIQDKAEYREYIQSVISRGVDLRGYFAEFSLVYLNDVRIGFTLITTMVGSPDKGIDLTMISLKNEYRGKGYGSVVLDAILGRYLPRMSVYACCLPASRMLQQMLAKRGFSEVAKSQDGVTLRHEAIGTMSAMAL